MYYDGQYSGKTPQEASKKATAGLKERLKKERTEVRRRKAKVTRVDQDGTGVAVEFTRDNGERVRARYIFLMWEKPPYEVAHATAEAMKQAPVPVATYRGWRAVPKPQPDPAETHPIAKPA
jgi:hypothetical protein